MNRVRSRIIGIAAALGLVLSLTVDAGAAGREAAQQGRQQTTTTTRAANPRAANPRTTRATRETSEPQVVTAEELPAHTGNRIFFANSAGTNPTIANSIRNHAIATGAQKEGFYMSAPLSRTHFEQSPHFRQNTLFVAQGAREGVTAGHVNRIRDHFHSLSKRIEKNEFNLDTVVVNVSPPNERGEVSMGGTGDLTMSAVKQVLDRGGKVIGVVNPNVPFMRGKNTIPYNKLSVVTHSNEPLAETTGAGAHQVEEKIAANVARLVPNGSTLQIGTGAALGAVGPALASKRNLKGWSEMGSDWLIDLMAPMHGGRPAMEDATVSFLRGSQTLNMIAADHPSITVPWIKIDSSKVVNNPRNIAQQKRMRAVNTALQVDLNGNVNAEEINGRVISSQGGQPNFAKGASDAPDGKSIMALRSLTSYGLSTLVPTLEGPTTTPSKHVTHVVTEWGHTPSLQGVNTEERTYQLLRVAHPFHRVDLAKQAFDKGMISQKAVDKLARSVFWSISRDAVPEAREALAEGAVLRNLITPEQQRQIMASLPPGTQRDPAYVVPLPPAAH